MQLVKREETKLLIPAWLRFSFACETGELSRTRRSPFSLSSRAQNHLESVKADFSDSRTPAVAADLLATAIACCDQETSKEAASFLVKSTKPGSLAYDIASQAISETRRFEKTEYQTAIQTLKGDLKGSPRDPVGWVERSRLYAILGQREKALYSMQIALNLAPENRYVIRSAVRLYLVYDEDDRAFDLVKRSSAAEHDRWIKATQISVFQLLEKPTPRIPRKILNSISPQEIFENAELLSAVGMLELKNGSDQYAKKAFRLAWKDPGRNAVTAGEWVIRKHLPHLEGCLNNYLSGSTEARAAKSYFTGDLNGALGAFRELELEEPYRRKPYIFGSHVACLEGRFDEAVRLAKHGAALHPDEFILKNNLAFAFCKAGKFEEARKVFAKVLVPADTTEKVCFYATLGLICFGEGNPAAGRKNYQTAVDEALLTGDKRLGLRVLINYAIAEVDSSSEDAGEIAVEVLENTEELQIIDLIYEREILRKKVLELNEPTENSSRFKTFEVPSENFTRQKIYLLE